MPQRNLACPLDQDYRSAHGHIPPNMRHLQSWELSQIRKYPRVEFIGPAHIICGEVISPARSRNLSLGGMMLESDLDYAAGTPVRIAFELPGGRAMNPHARVIHCRPGARLGVEFVDLKEYERNSLRDYIQLDGESQRRSIRVPQRLFIRVRWSEGGCVVDVAAETILLAQHGCMVMSPTLPPAETLLTLWWPEKSAGAEARVVWRRREAGGWSSAALEFTTDTNFWGIEFARDTT